MVTIALNLVIAELPSKLFLYIITIIHIAYPASVKTVINGTSAVLECKPAEELVRTHMSPDFETPQLIRRLDWLLEDSIIASYQQDVLSDASRQWWVSDRRLQLIRPFYALRFSACLPHDSGLYHCRLETDPLFALTVSTGSILLIIMVRPPSPTKPEITAVTKSSVTLSWKTSTSQAHRPILRHSVLVRLTAKNEERIITLQGNNTSAMVSGLLPLTRYAFSVQAENAAGASEFSLENLQTTLGEAFTSAPTILDIQNTSDGCIKAMWKGPHDPSQTLTGYRVMIHRLGSPTMREWYSKSKEHTLCGLPFNSEFRISVEADNGYGYSPSASSIFYTDESIPDGPPQNIRLHTLSSSVIQLKWSAPERPNGYIVAYQIYIRRIMQNTPNSIRLNIRGSTKSRYSYNISNLDDKLVSLDSQETYAISISALTSKGEGDKSKEFISTTDFDDPVPPKIMNITYNCKRSVTVYWSEESTYAQFYSLHLEGNVYRNFNTTNKQANLTELSLRQRYSVKVLSAVRSLLDNRTVIYSQWSDPEVFEIDDPCIIHTSSCANSWCEKLSSTAAYSSSMTISILAFLIAILFSSVAVLFIKRRCDIEKKKCLQDHFFKENRKSFIYESVGGESIPVAFFDEYCKKMSENDNLGFRRQFEDIEKDSSLAEDYRGDEHRSKDRYLNICAIESTRIRLNLNNSDYINANYVDSCESRRAYIATQAPLPHTFADFWEMIWQEHCNVIVVITNLVEHGRRKCDQYWPDILHSSRAYHNLTVAFDKEHSNAHFIHRYFTIKLSKCLLNERKVHQLHFTSWPDHGVPNNVFPLLSFMDYVSEITTTGPIVVHCSAGVGRSGSYILIDSMRKHLLLSDKLNLEGHLRRIRQQRFGLVQTSDQYIFCHEAIRRLIQHGPTRIHIDNFLHYTHHLFHATSAGRTYLQIQYEDICKCVHEPCCVPPIGYEVFPGFHNEDEFIVATWPFETEALWQLVWTKSCQTIVVMGCGDNFWKDMTVSGDLSIQRDCDDVWIISSKEDQLCVRTVIVSQCDFELDTWTEIERIQQRRLQYHQSPLLILNHQNNSMAHILCVLTSIACQIEAESCLDVLQFLSSYKAKLCGAWRTQCDIEIIYDKLLIMVQNLLDDTA